MCMHWIFVAFALITQEVISLNAVIFAAHAHRLPVVLIHVLFVLATIIDIVIGYAIGAYARKKLTRGKITSFAEKWSARFASYAGKKGRWVALLILGNFSFPYINAFLAGWLEMPFIESFIFLFLGNIVWYGFLWLIVLGVVSAVPNAWIAFPIIAAIAIGILLVIRKQKMEKF